MNKESSRYIFLYSAVLALLSALLLALAATLLKPYQQKNIETEKKQNILVAVHKALDIASAPNKTHYVDGEYARYITSSYVVNQLGEQVEGDAFGVNLDVELHKDPVDMSLPVFICTNDSGTMQYILPMRGQGLWGAIWGYVALCEDLSTIYGVVFDHKSETPGLGAEIATPEFQNQLVGKQIFDLKTSDFVSIKVLKGSSSQGNAHAIDAISGGTITSKAVEKMMRDFFSLYLNYFKVERQKQVLQQREVERQQQREADAEAARLREEVNQRWLKRQAERAAQAALDSAHSAPQHTAGATHLDAPPSEEATAAHSTEHHSEEHND